MSQINFTGAQGTGKTTLLNMFKDRVTKGYIFNTEVVRNIIKTRGINFNEGGDGRSQEYIFMAYLNFLIENKNEDYISDRCIIDPLAYSIWLYRNNRIDKSIVDFQLRTTEAAIRNGYLKNVYYFPIEFDVVNDGVRSTNEKFRHEIDAIIRDILYSMVDKYPGFIAYELSGTPEERYNEMLGF